MENLIVKEKIKKLITKPKYNYMVMPAISRKSQVCSSDTINDATVTAIKGTITEEIGSYLITLEQISIKRQAMLQSQLLQYFMTKYTDASLSEIGKSIYGTANRHANVIHSSKAVDNLRETDKTFKAMTDRIFDKMNERGWNKK